MPLPAKFFIAFAAVLALIAVTAWLVRKFAADRLGGGSARGRQPRLAVIDAATVDGRRRLVLIRRDNVEHLMMIGGPTDVVVEQNIVRAAPAAPRAPETPARAAEPALRQTPAVDSGFPLQPVTETAPLPPPRPYRAPATEEPWHAPEPGARPRPASTENSLSGLAAELSGRLAPPDVAPPVAPVAPPVAPPAARHEAPRMAAPQVSPQVAPPAEFEPGTAPQTDHNLAEMAQQLEAALRRAPAAEGRAPVTDPLATQPAMPMPPKPVEVPRREYKLRVDPRFEGAAPEKIETKAEPKLDAKFEPRIEPTLAPARPDMPRANPTAKPAPAGKPAAEKSVYDSLEEEMASLLGRPPGKT
ncbi:MAG: flagellar biosynthetic protein FliO [Proteobacteria bacterium]|nr:flagellar biosynthetic protein FliO [Pseudomonadota bacterium]